jgi:hypothetical protein
MGCANPAGIIGCFVIVGKRVVSSCATPGQTGVCGKWLGYEVSVPVPFGLTMTPDFWQYEDS